MIAPISNKKTSAPKPKVVAKSMSTPNRRTGGNTPTVSGPALSLSMVSPNATQLTRPSEDATFHMAGSDLLVRLDGLQRVIAVNLLPGQTGLTKLDSMALHYSWAKYNSNMVLAYKPLSDVTTNGVWFYRVVHDINPSQLADPAMWNVHTRAFTAQKASLPFSINVPVSAMRNSRNSPLNSRTGSYILLVHSGQSVDIGEFHLKYDITLGGVSALTTSSTLYEVDKGVFKDPLTHKPLDGVPTMGNKTSFKFLTPATIPQIEDLANRLEGAPVLIVRPEDEPVIHTTDDRGKATQIVVAHEPYRKPTFAQKIQKFAENLEAVEDAVARSIPLVKRVTRFIKPYWLGSGSGSLPSPTRESTSNNVGSQNATGSFSSYSGTVLVEDGNLEMKLWSSVPSTPVLMEASTQDGQRGARLAWGPLASLLWDGVLLAADVSSVVSPFLIDKIVKQKARNKNVVHRGLDALSAVYTYPAPEVSGPGNGDGENPLPELPDFGGDPIAPGKVVDWVTTLRYFTGHVVDDKGTARVKFLGGWPRKGVRHISPPGPVNYWELRKPWDDENKRTLGCYVKLSRELKNHFLVLQGAVLGDDACACWWPSVAGAKYIGTTALFGGITLSRSVIYIEDVDKFNSAEVNLSIGQSRRNIMDADEGRTCMFNVMLGAVADPDIAVNFLRAWPRTPPMINQVWTKKGVHTNTNGFASDFNLGLASRSSDLDVGLEPFAPGFQENYKQYMADKQAGRTTRTLPVAIEAGPFFLVYAGRLDDANGWYQHFPYFSMSDTDYSAQWHAEFRVGNSGSTDWYRKPDDSKCGRGQVALIHLPSSLISGAKYSVESYGVCAYHTVLADGCHSSSDKSPWDDGTPVDFDASIPGPLGITRYSGNAENKFLLVNGSLINERATDAVDGWSGDLYHHGVHIVYLLKDTEAANRWSRFDMTGTEVYKITEGETTHSGSEDSKVYARLSEIIPTAGRNWDLTEKEWPTSYPTDGWSSAPCRSECPLYHAGGRSREVNDLQQSVIRLHEQLRTMEKALQCAGSFPSLLDQKPLDPVDEEANKPSNLPWHPDHPAHPESAIKIDDLVEVKHFDVLPVESNPKIPVKFDDKYAVTRFSLVNKQTGTTAYNETESNTWRNVTEFNGYTYVGSIDYHDSRGVVPVSGDTVGITKFHDFVTDSENISTSSAGNSLEKQAWWTGYMITTPMGMPKLSKGSDVVTIAQMWRCGKMSWTYSPDARLNVVSLFQGNAWFQFGTSVKKQSVGSTSVETATNRMKKDQTVGHSHPFRKRKCQIFIPKELDQRDHDYYNNWVLIMLEVDMADPNAIMADVINKFAIIREDSHAPLQQGITIASTDTYDEVLHRALDMLPEMIEFQGKFGLYETGISTYNTPEAPPIEFEQQIELGNVIPGELTGSQDDSSAPEIAGPTQDAQT